MRPVRLATRSSNPGLWPTRTTVPAKQAVDTAVHAAAASQPGNPAKLVRSESVGPQVGKELAINGLYAAIFVVVLVLLVRWVIASGVAA